MRKIVTLFKRNPENRQLVLPEYAVELPDRAVPTVKFDGTACMITTSNEFYSSFSPVTCCWKRYDVKPGRSVPEGSIACGDKDEATGHWPHWVPIVRGKAEDKWFWEGYDNKEYIALIEFPHWDGSYRKGLTEWPSGTYELVGPKVNANPYGLTKHELWRHGSKLVLDAPCDYEGLKAFLNMFTIEGIVWWVDGEPFAKIKRRDFGIPWPVSKKPVVAEVTPEGVLVHDDQ